MKNAVNKACHGCDQSLWIETEGGKGYLKCCSETSCSLTKFPMPEPKIIFMPEEIRYIEDKKGIVEFECAYQKEWHNHRTNEGGNKECIHIFKIPQSGILEGNMFLKCMWADDFTDKFSDYSYKTFFDYILLRFIKNNDGEIVPEFRFILGEWRGYEDSVFCNNDGTLSDGREHQNVNHDYENCKRLEIR